MSVPEITVIKLSAHYDPDQNTKFRGKKKPQSCYLHEEKRSKDEIGSLADLGGGGAPGARPPICLAS